MKTFHCGRCNHLVFFENVQCERCAATLGYEPGQYILTAFEPVGENLWRLAGGSNDDAGRRWHKCRNYAVENVCNWMVNADDGHPLCRACRLTRVIPSLAKEPNRLYWYRIEVAKRRLLYTLDELRLPVVMKESEEDNGLAFEFMEDTAKKKVMTGHATGLITLNIAEADDAYRERLRTEMHEPYRTLLGHFRHEVGHYYFDQLVDGTAWLEPFRKLFGDERADYGKSLQRHYEHGAPEGWETSYISAYATMHPWEDWAETWAHYLHMFDTLDTAEACGLALAPRHAEEPEIPVEHHDMESASFDEMVALWFPLTYVINSLNRSLGQADSYPFTLPTRVLEKLRFVHRVIHACGDAAAKKAVGQGADRKQTPAGV
jgi:hypothetical protein